MDSHCISVLIISIGILQVQAKPGITHRFNGRVYRFVGDNPSDAVKFPPSDNLVDSGLSLSSNDSHFKQSKTDLNDKAIPEVVKIRLKEVKSFTDLKENLLDSTFIEDDLHLEYLTEGNMGDNETAIDNRKTVPNPFLLSAPAGCSPELKTIKLESPSLESEIYFPWCIKLPQCSGCCPSKRLECVATKTTHVNISSAHLRFTKESQKFKFMGLKVFTMEQHETCKCECIQKESDCNAAQIYRPDECRCVCKDIQKAVQCLMWKNKYWDVKTCSCKCKNTKHCSTGLTFSQDTCKCVEQNQQSTRDLKKMESLLTINDYKEHVKEKQPFFFGGINPDVAPPLF